MPDLDPAHVEAVVDVIDKATHDLGVGYMESEAVAAIAKAIDYLVTHPQEAERMGRNGQRAVAEKYNWGIEESKLLQFYVGL